MAGVDSLLRMMANHGADELRLGTNLPPKMLQRGSPVRLSIPPTDDAMLQHLLDGILTPDREASLQKDAKLELSYEGHAVSLQARDGRIEAVFRKGARPAPVAAPSPPVAAPPPPAPPPPAPIMTTSASLLERAVSLQASDIHLLQGGPATV